MTSIYILLAAVLIFILVLIKYIRIIPQSEQYVIERLGSYHATWGVGIHVMVPFIDRIANQARRTNKSVLGFFAFIVPSCMIRHPKFITI